MDIGLLLDIVTLIIRETQSSTDTNSDTIIFSILDMYDKDDKKWKRRDNTVVKQIVSIIKSMLETRSLGEELDLGSISRSLGLLLTSDEDISESDSGSLVHDIVSSITKPLDTDNIDNEIKRLKVSIRNIHAREKLKQVMSRKNLELSKHEINSGEVFGFIDKAILDLEEIQASSDKSDEAIIGEVDLAADNLEEATANSIILKHVFKTGHQALNRMLQGGIRTSEFATIGALSFNYKTGFTLTTWLGVLLNNKPRPTADGIKPLAVWLSFEDDLINIIEGLFKIIYITEEGEDPDLSLMSLEGMIDIVQQRLHNTGFNVKILRVNPSMWTYKDIFNKLASYKSKGFETQLLAVDYVDKLPMPGLGNGVAGTDKKDIIKRIRNHMAALDIAFLTPWQLSAAANALIKDGMAPKDLLTYVHDKSYYQGSSTLNTEIDLEMFVNVVATPKNEDAKHWLHVHRGKHKLSSVLSDIDDMSFFLPFPKKGSIALDIIGDKVYPDISKRTLTSSIDTSTFSF